MSKAKENKILKNIINDKKKRIAFIFITIIIAVIIVILLWFTVIYGYISVDDAYLDRDKATISSKILTRVSSILVNEGDKVKKDQILVQLDNSELLAQKKQAEANLEFIKESSDLAKINLEKAEDNFRRMSTIYKSNNTSYENYFTSKKSYEIADQSYKMAIKQIDVSSAQLDLVNVNLQNTTIKSVFNGIVSKKWVVDGDIIQPGQPILSVNNTESLWVIANIAETKLSYVHVNSEVKISVDAYHGKKFKGKIIQIGADTASQFSLIPPNNASGNFTKITQRVPIKISIFPANAKEEISDYNLVPGMSVIVKIKKKKKV